MTKARLNILAGLFLFGVVFNKLFNLFRPRLTEPYTAEWVILGVGVTVMGAALARPYTPGWVLACFAASGLPMAIGDAERYARKHMRLTRYARGR